jgi:hypothetical protein
MLGYCQVFELCHTFKVCYLFCVMILFCILFARCRKCPVPSLVDTVQKLCSLSSCYCRTSSVPRIVDTVQKLVFGKHLVLPGSGVFPNSMYHSETFMVLETKLYCLLLLRFCGTCLMCNFGCQGLMALYIEAMPAYTSGIIFSLYSP